MQAMQLLQVCSLQQLPYKCTEIAGEIGCSHSLAKTQKQFPQHFICRLYKQLPKRLLKKFYLTLAHTLSTLNILFNCLSVQKPRCSNTITWPSHWPIQFCFLSSRFPQIGFAISSHVVSITKVCLFDSIQSANVY